MSDAAGAGSGAPDRRKSGRERRRPLTFDASDPVKKVKPQQLSKKEKAAAAKAKQEAAVKAALPSPSDPTAFTNAAQNPRGKLAARSLVSVRAAWPAPHAPSGFFPVLLAQQQQQLFFFNRSSRFILFLFF